MLVDKQFDFGKIIVDTKRAVLFVDRGQGIEEFQVSPKNKDERKVVFDWIHNHPEVDYYDESRLAWNYKVCANCAVPPEVQSFDNPEILKIQSPDKADEVKLELIGAHRVYTLRRVQDIGLILINSERLVHFLGKDLNWMAWDKDKGWVVQKDLDEVDTRFVREVIGVRADRFFA